MTPSIPRSAVRLLTFALAASLTPGVVNGGQVKGPAPRPEPPRVAGQADELTSIVKSQHKRLTFTRDITRLAVGDDKILSAELVTAREVLVLGKETGRTTLIVWLGNGVSRNYLFSVQRDLSVLERALKTLNPSINVESAPDRDALVLTGTVPDAEVSERAETMAYDYLSQGSRSGAGQVQVAAAPSDAAPAGSGGAGTGTVAPASGSPQPPSIVNAAVTQSQGGGAQSQGALASKVTIINLLRLVTLPAVPEEKILEAIRSIGGQSVTIRRMIRGDIRSDGVDTLVLEGHVLNQIALVRVLSVAAQLFTGKAINTQDIHVVADEGGALAQSGSGQAQGQSGQTQLGGGASSSLFGGGRGARLTNELQKNIGRAKALEAAGGRILSFITVTDLPQIRVDVRLVEVNRSKLRSLNPNSSLLTSNFRQPSLNPAQSAVAAQGDQAARVGSGGAAVQSVLSFLNGGLLQQLQFAGDHLAIDSVLALLEREGIAQSLSSPSLTVLSGELAQVQVGGEIPVPTAFATASTGATGVLSSTDFVPFGVQLQIRPLVGDDDTITLDVQPQVVTPDLVLTDSLRQSTGAAVATTAFQTRALRTSSRLQDGQALLIGGLLSNNTSTNSATAPGLGSVPILGKLFQSFSRNDQSTELIVVVNPVVIRSPLPEMAIWAFPDRAELMRPLLGATPGASKQERR